MKAGHRVFMDPRGRRKSGFTHPLAGGGMSLKTLCPAFVLMILLFSCWKADAVVKEGYVPEVGRSVRPRMTLIASEDRGTYDCRLIEFNVERGESIRACLLVPEAADRSHKCPAVVMLHDHGARFDIGKEKLVRPMLSSLPDGADDHIAVSSRQWIDKNFDGVYLADSLASLGYVVLVADALYWGERSSDEAQRWSELNYGPDAHPKRDNAEIKALKNAVYDGQKTLYDSLLDKGIIWAEKMLRDDVASVRLLKSLPYVDKGNIGAFGFSMGAHRCWMLAAFCDEVKCGVALSWMTSLERDERMKPSDFSMAVMPMRERLDFGDIGAFLAPKPMLFLNGESDHLFPMEKVQKAFGRLQKHYSEYNVSRGKGNVQPSFAPLQTVFFRGGHHCGKEVQSSIVRFFDDNLTDMRR